jgi:HEAT repeat protein/MinD-like ATPase involved in chromosome partitioning or flagellar assembly
MTPPNRSGTIVTFYSYKGGTGRTMALVNLAWVLATNQKKVLLIDWDLEAPGLHRYLKPFLIDPDLQITPGLIDYVWDLAGSRLAPITDATVASENVPELETYVVGLDWNFTGEGSIAFVPAGQQNEAYSHRVNTFDWNNFYERLGGGKHLNAVRNALRRDYDYVLIDSRTGVSDTSGICTVQMPDMLVVCFTLNHQSVRGAAAVAESVQRQRGPGLPIFPVPTRLENAETDKLDAAMSFGKRMFAPFLGHVQKTRKDVDLREQDAYWADVGTPYRTFYAFEEIPAVFKDRPGRHDTILASTERLASWMTKGEISALEPIEEGRCQSVVASYAFANMEIPNLVSTYDFFITASPDVAILAEALSSGLSNAGLSVTGITLNELASSHGGWPPLVEQSRHGVFVFGRERTDVLDTQIRRFVKNALDLDGDRLAIPVTTDSTITSPLPGVLRSYEVTVSGPDTIAGAVSRISEMVAGKGRNASVVVEIPEIHVARDFLASKDPLTRRAGALALARIATREANLMLLDCLSDADKVVSRSAAEAAKRLDEPDAERFLDGLLSSDAQMRVTSALLLGIRGDQRAFLPLVRLLNDSNPALRKVGAEALGGFGQLAIEWLLPRLADSAAEVRRSVAESLVQLDQHLTVENQISLWRANDYISISIFDAYFLNPSRMEFLINRIAERSNAERAKALATEIGKKNGDQARSLCERLALGFDVPSIRAAIATVLGSIGGPMVTEVLIECLSDENVDARAAATGGLGLTAQPSATAALIKATRDSEALVRRAAYKALGSKDNLEALQALAKGLGDHDGQARAAAADSLGKVGRQDFAAALVEAASDSEIIVRVAVFNALGSIGGSEAVKVLVDGLGDTNSRVRDAAVAALIRLANSPDIAFASATYALFRCASDPDPELRAAVIPLLKSLGTSEATATLVKLLNDSDARVRVKVAQALGSVPEVALLLKDPESEVRLAALAASVSAFDYTEQALLTENLDRKEPWLDPATIIDQDRVSAAARRFRLTDKSIIATYEKINIRLGNKLTLAWSS